MILDLTSEYSFGSLNFEMLNDNEESDRFINISKIEFENDISETFFVDLLQMCIEAVKNTVPDNERMSIIVCDYKGYDIRLKLLHRNISIEYYFYNNKKICTILLEYSLKKFVKEILSDYKRLTEEGELKAFVNEDRGYMDIINKYYQGLEKLYKNTF